VAAASSNSFELERVERLEDLREDWISLADQTGHPFATWEWNQCWWRWFGEDRELYTYRCLNGNGDVIAILPLYVAAVRPLRVARFLGYADMHSPICEPSTRPLVAEALRAATRQPGGCSLLVAERLPCAEGWGDLLGGKAFERVNDPMLKFDGMSWEEFLASRSSNFRAQVGKRERRAIRKHGLTYRLADDPGRLAEDMESLFRLHAARWGAETTGVFEGDRASFHHDFAAESRVLSSGPIGRAASLGLNFASTLPDPLRRRVMRITG